MSARLSLYVVAILGLAIGAQAQSDTPRVLTTTEARTHVGERATVCGTVASARYSNEGRQPTFLNFDKPYPNQVFTALIWGANRAKFGKPEETYKDKRICVTGKIELYRNSPEIIIDDPQQLTIQEGKP